MEVNILKQIVNTDNTSETPVKSDMNYTIYIIIAIIAIILIILIIVLLSRKKDEDDIDDVDEYDENEVLEEDLGQNGKSDLGLPSLSSTDTPVPLININVGSKVYTEL